MDLPRDELLHHAQNALKELGGDIKVFFKFTCKGCGARVIFDEPNKLFESGECCECGLYQTVTEGAYALDIPVGKPVQSPS